MALDITKLNRISNGTSKVFLYAQAVDNAAAMVAADYFLDADIQPQLDVGDVIICVDSATPTVDVVVVTTSTSAGITVTNGT